MTIPSRPYDIAIAGCGPAGLAAALLLHRDGHKVTLFERFDAPRAIGSGLMIQPTGLTVLARLGLAKELLARGARIDALYGVQESGRVALDARYSELGIPRCLRHRRASCQLIRDTQRRSPGAGHRPTHELRGARRQNIR